MELMNDHGRAPLTGEDGFLWKNEDVLPASLGNCYQHQPEGGATSNC
jgi:hypothetical protein